MPALTLAIPAAHPLLLGIPMDMDAARQLHTALLLCQRCQKPEHFAWHYPLGLESSGRAPEECRGEFDGICELELPDKTVEVEDQIYATTIHLPPSVVEIWASQTMSHQLAQAFAANTVPQEFQDVVPPYLYALDNVFSKALFDSLPEHKRWDHAIELLPDFTLSSCKVYLLVPREQDELNTFLQENLDSSCICLSKSPMASLVFFIKKKDGSLQLVQDY
ncbi:hypothetical protein E4T56_gene10526 [Termitomyces sp. T112]|nr:hypothetical protein E4T56_gene10526 [Termitomyces sp. T112]